MDLAKWVLKFPAALYGVQFLNDIAIHVLKTGPIPNHIAIVMDGNRRYAQSRNIETVKGHTAGFETFLRTAQVCSTLGVKTVTVYAFSIENFNRGQEETDKLFNMVRTSLAEVSDGDDSLAKRLGWKIKILGNRDMIPDDLKKDIEKIERLTAENTGTVINICCPYTSRDDMAQAVRKAAENGQADPEGISESAFKSCLYTADAEPLDILIRTSGTTRLSDFMLWECVDGSQVEFASPMWPEYTVLDLYLVILRWGLKQLSSKDKVGRISLDKLPSPPAAVSVNVTDFKFK
ncbi:Dehydrodolichyl diphosphate synthase complex subunit SPAC4D7.04c [Wickerhamiella sorbophila]|uniref:Alkyl transferase n=1 Tax=Wickerhamiella sorbophila TaxID=45607 RepID=A0A2T0FMZ3_9ASCO|nr:Dehydrodolichyl diphosphate synthase complex subunit SPAC4D7.04c [Wickerhamiella sorbophila]PRT56368.1 Dehydrodolichyl diphosphate synthase complex subunit SPAC4D7.04c [Wickerhamiella sorbophila]